MAMNAVTSNLSVPSLSNVEKLKEDKPANLEGEKVRLHKATKEFEAFFMYQLLKTMRETVPDASAKKDGLFSGGMGKDIFTDMFDMQMADKMATGGRNSISDLLYRSLEKVIDAQQPDSASPVEIKSLRRDKVAPAPLHEKKFDKLQTPQKDFKIKVNPTKFLPNPAANRPVEGDSILSRFDKHIDEAAEQTSLLLPNPAANRPVEGDSILSRFGQHIDEAAKQTSLDPALIISVIQTESSGNPKAVSPAGAKGLMQLADSTATDYGVREVFDPAENIKAGSRYLRNLIDRFGSVKLGLAAYNAGPGNVEKYQGIPPFKETVNYVNKVLDTLSNISGGSPPGRPKVLSKTTDK